MLFFLMIFIFVMCFLTVRMNYIFCLLSFVDDHIEFSDERTRLQLYYYRHAQCTIYKDAFLEVSLVFRNSFKNSLFYWDVSGASSSKYFFFFFHTHKRNKSLEMLINFQNGKFLMKNIFIKKRGTNVQNFFNYIFFFYMTFFN